MNKEYLKRDNSIGFLRLDMLNSYKVLISHANHITEETNALFQYSEEDTFTIDVWGIVVQVNIESKDCTILRTGKSIRETFPTDDSVYSDKRLNRLIGWFESDVKDFCEAINKLTQKERYELLSI